MCIYTLHGTAVYHWLSMEVMSLSLGVNEPLTLLYVHIHTTRCSRLSLHWLSMGAMSLSLGVSEPLTLLYVSWLRVTLRFDRVSFRDSGRVRNSEFAHGVRTTLSSCQQNTNLFGRAGLTTPTRLGFLFRHTLYITFPAQRYLRLVLNAKRPLVRFRLAGAVPSTPCFRRY